MAMSATLSVVGNVIVGRPATCVLTISNSGNDAVNVTSISPKVFVGGTVVAGASGPARVSPVFVPVNQAVASTTGMQNSIQVGSASSVNVTFQFIAEGPTDSAAQAANGGASYLVGADITASDGSVFSPVPQSVAVAPPQNGRPAPAPNSSATTYGGQLLFNLGANSALAL